MAIPTSITRLKAYYARHGFGATIRRAGQALKREIFSNRMVVFYCDLAKRFARGSSLWLIKSGEKLAGYGWTMEGHTIASYYFLLGEDDVQLFDFYVFPKFRGRAMHWLLTAHILQTLAAEGRARAFADTAEWNQAQLSSFKMTPFRRLGLARSFRILGHTFVSWVENEPVEQIQKDTERRDKAPTMARPHEQ
jgi:ribosomal protein S18 acetylase RimI-like enzyme